MTIWIENTVSFLWDYLFMWILILGGVFFTFRMKFVQLTTFFEAFRLLGGREKLEGLEVSEARKDKKRISSFQAFCLSASSRIGTGNVAGVGLAVAAGGPGAIFWMWAMALVGAATGVVESTLSQIYKEKQVDGHFIGGPAFYFQKIFKSKLPSIVFCVLIAITYGLILNSVQTNTIAVSFEQYVPRLFIGIGLSVVVLFIIFGGVTRITRFASILMPFIILSYLMICIGVIVLNMPQFLNAMGMIVRSAFGLEQAAGGAAGYAISVAVQTGLRRGLFSNEAGIGSVPIAAAAASATHPAKQGIIQGAGVFIDTIIINSATAFMIIMAGAYLLVDPATGESFTGAVLVRQAMVTWIGPMAAPFVNASIFLLAFTSLFGNYYYGETSIRYATKKPFFVDAYRIVVGGFVIFAALAPLGLVWDLADIFTGIAVTMNIIALTILSKIAANCLNDYKRQLKAFKNKTGDEPVFYDDLIGIDTSCWKRGR